MEEIWKDIIGFEGIYQISNFGRIKSLERLVKCGILNSEFRIVKERILKPAINRNGYYKVCLKHKFINKTLLVHRLIAQAFIPNPENKPTINHINGIKTDNRIVNLEWCTMKENNVHAFATGLKRAHNKSINVGAVNSNAKLKEADVLKIRQLLSDGETLGAIAEKYNVGFTAIHKIKIGQTWKNVA